MGLPNTAENPALMPHMMARSWNSPPRPVPLRTSSAREPPICRAAPSRPAEPPKAWVSTVAQNTTGASRRETGCSPRAAWMIRSVPPAVLMPPRRYIHTTTSPARGRRRLAQAVPLRSTSAQASSRSNRPPRTPTSSPTPSPKSRPWPLSRRLSLLKAISVYSPRKKAVTGLPPFRGEWLGSPMAAPPLSVQSFAPVYHNTVGGVCNGNFPPGAGLPGGAPCGKMGDGWRQPTTRCRPMDSSTV